MTPKIMYLIILTGCDSAIAAVKGDRHSIYAHPFVRGGVGGGVKPRQTISKGRSPSAAVKGDRVTHRKFTQIS
ncbi:hypothetical protein [Anabaenopsis arnoldii]|uniref:Secreted protein n=1 Tax=Anabaenopsis arnoldii TaxID=2152938 RepID=A0ABT5AT53_9CYAN|nr:hypothetical protein [Anabaenopsis arnoldii]MDB9539893.1 hypothetical protein [Anabaenopsis arnoldii]MDH6092197.1 hypothetical protein [Anabaenopsis arnoldii]